MSSADFSYINTAYGLNVKRGSRIEYTGSGAARQGKVVSSEGQYFNVRFDDNPMVTEGPFHPRWEMRVLEPSNAS